MIEKNRGNEVILEMVEVLKNKNFEFPRAHIAYKNSLYTTFFQKRQALFLTQNAYARCQRIQFHGAVTDQGYRQEL